ncbi:M35 family metallo-endopeptidase [Myxococcus sp. RHSTA-1-4]|uniref:M35 family metallo-endopeptidase n=1 Tax=Myxococcus sp. RHSTA-1-4 TaxID=2874601 RepID=UPI001CBD6E80|nr:M35 family metallo-endopeptidase [Myxococcus sp. RHSTA-1-4]MBZ4416209.1 peptidase M35 [Myxococcus sp. RHSTA-1-4]
MSLNLRGRLNWWMGALASVSLLGACGAPDERAEDALESNEAVRDAVAGDVAVKLSVGKSAMAARDNVLVTVTMTNVSSRTVRVLKWHTPVDGLKEDLFKVTADGVAAEYNGRHYKWATPQATDYLNLAPGESVSSKVDLASVYDFSKTATYDIRFDSAGHHDATHDGVSQLSSGSVSVFVEGRPFVHPEAEAAPGTVTAMALSTANCSSTRVTSVTTAFNSAKTYANNAVTYLSGTPSATSRFTTWFGTYSSTNWNTIKTHFTSIKSAFDTKSVIVDCGCSDSAYAYVYKNSPYRIYVCNAFWSAPNTGTDSRAGTLIHEMSHFTVVADTDDWAYGQSAAKSLATSNPTRARDNADSHEYFAENTPSLP